MTFLTLTILCSLISTGCLQEINNADYHLNHLDVDKTRGGDWPQQSTYGQEQRNNIPQPCSRRSNSESELIKKKVLSPAHSLKIDTVSTNDNTATLKPHALRNLDYNVKTFKNQEPPSYPHIYSDDNHIYKTKTPLLVSNPVIDSFEEIHHEPIPPINSEVRENILKQLHNHYYHSSESPPALRVPSEVHPVPARDFDSAPTSQFHFVPNSEYGVAPSSQYLIPGHVISPEHNVNHPTVDNDVDSVPSTNFLPEPANDLHYEPEHLLPLEPATELHSEPTKHEPVSKVNDAAPTAPNKCTHEEPDNLVGHSRRSMSSYNNDDNLRSNVNSDNDLVHSNNDQYIESRIGNENAMASVLNVNQNNLKSSPDQNRSYPKVKLAPHEKIVLRAGRTQFNDSRRELTEPTKGNGITNMAQSSLMLMQTERICYACSTANNPNCWAPDRRTTVKYCRKGNTACMTKTFGSGSTFTLIRDCGKSCDDSETGGLMPKYKSCSMCHTELCNGTYSINGHSIILALLIIPLIKYLN